MIKMHCGLTRSNLGYAPDILWEQANWWKPTSIITSWIQPYNNSTVNSRCQIKYDKSSNNDVNGNTEVEEEYIAEENSSVEPVNRDN